jgi:hypothetical protein
MILLCEHPAAVAGPVRKWKTFFVFQGAFLVPSFARALFGMRERNQRIGPACADQGHLRAALDANDLATRQV